MKRWAYLLAILLTCCICVSCAASMPVSGTAEEHLELLIAHTTPYPASLKTPMPSHSPIPSPTPSPTPKPVSQYATIGAVGDIMMMESQIRGAWNGVLAEYDFTPSFTGLLPWFLDTDLLCGNLETPLAGENAGYSGPAPTQPTPDEFGEAPKKPFQTFNAPDALACSLYKANFRVLTTANNHCLDRGMSGLYRTAEVIRQSGIMQLGAYLSKEDRDTARIADINGIKIGFVAWTNSVNRNDNMLSSGERSFAVGRTSDKAGMKRDIELCRQAGADCVIAFVHWDIEFQDAPSASTRRMAKWMLENGVDVIFGSHPHVVQPIEYMEVERDSGAYKGLVVYSLGNFISNMAPSPKDYGVYVKVTFEKTPEGKVSLVDAGYLPVYCIKHKVQGRTLHEVLPACEDVSLIDASGEITDKILEGLQKARTYVKKICGEEISLLA